MSGFTYETRRTIRERFASRGFIAASRELVEVGAWSCSVTCPGAHCSMGIGDAESSFDDAVIELAKEGSALSCADCGWLGKLLVFL